VKEGGTCKASRSLFGNSASSDVSLTKESPAMLSTSTSIVKQSKDRKFYPTVSNFLRSPPRCTNSSSTKNL